MAVEAARYSRVPISIFAVQFTADNGQELADWVNGPYYYIPHGKDAPSYRLDVPAPIGVENATLTDWIVQHLDGTYEVIEDDSFTSQYQLMTDEEATL